MKEATITVLPKTEYQWCIVQQVKNTLKKESIDRSCEEEPQMDAEVSKFYETLER